MRIPGTQFFYLRLKIDPSTVSFFSIGHKSSYRASRLILRGVHINFMHGPPYIFPKYMSGVKLVERRIEVQLEAIKKMANALPTSGEHSSGVKIH